MTPNQQNIKIAELIGYRWGKHISGQFYAWFRPDGTFIHMPLLQEIQLTKEERAVKDLPKFSTDLNAMQRAEQIFFQAPYNEDGTLGTWLVNLSNIVTRRKDKDYDSRIHVVAVISATAAQRAEAFIKTLTHTSSCSQD